MGLALGTAVATPELIGVLAWWGVVLAVPVVLLRRLRHRRPANADRRLRGRERRRLANRIQLPGPARSDGEPIPLLMRSGGTAAGSSESGRASVRLAPGTLEPLCRYVDFRRRLELAVSELGRRLSALPHDRWRIEPYPLTGERRNTLLVLGDTGLFVISATYAPGHWDDVITVNRLAGKIKSLLLGYPGEVHPAICHPFSSVPPRIWYREGQQGEWIAAWLVGGDSVLEWLEHFGQDCGVRPGDLKRFDDLCKPNWLRPAISTPATWPPLSDWALFPPQE